MHFSNKNILYLFRLDLLLDYLLEVLYLACHLQIDHHLLMLHVVDHWLLMLLLLQKLGLIFRVIFELPFFVNLRQSATYLATVVVVNVYGRFFGQIGQLPAIFVIILFNNAYLADLRVQFEQVLVGLPSYVRFPLKTFTFILARAPFGLFWRV